MEFPYGIRELKMYSFPFKVNPIKYKLLQSQVVSFGYTHQQSPMLH